MVCHVCCVHAEVCGAITSCCTLIKLQDGTILGGKEQEKHEEMEMSDIKKKNGILIGGDSAEQRKTLQDMIGETKICEKSEMLTQK